MCAGLSTITRSPSKHCSRMYRAREMCGRNVTTMTVRHPYRAAKRRSARPSPFVVGGSGMKQCKFTAGYGYGAAQTWVSHGSLGPFGFDTATVGAQPFEARAKPNGYLA